MHGDELELRLHRHVERVEKFKRVSNLVDIVVGVWLVLMLALLAAGTWFAHPGSFVARWFDLILGVVAASVIPFVIIFFALRLWHPILRDQGIALDKKVRERLRP